MYSVFHNAIRPRNKFHPRLVCSLMICNQKGAKKRPADMPAKPLRKACQTPPQVCDPKSHTPKRLCKACMIVSHTVKRLCKACMIVSHTVKRLRKRCMIVSHTATTLCRCCIVPPHTVKGVCRCCIVILHTVKGVCRCCTLISHTPKGPSKRCMIVSHTLPVPRRCCTLISHTATACARGERDLSGWLPNGFAEFGRSFEAGCISLSMHPITDIQYEYTNSNHLSFDGRLHDDVGPARGAREVCVHL